MASTRERACIPRQRTSRRHARTHRRARAHAIACMHMQMRIHTHAHAHAHDQAHAHAHTDIRAAKSVIASKIRRSRPVPVAGAILVHNNIRHDGLILQVRFGPKPWPRLQTRVWVVWVHGALDRWNVPVRGGGRHPTVSLSGNVLPQISHRDCTGVLSTLCT
jgi:hypothetical protein